MSMTDTPYYHSSKNTKAEGFIRAKDGHKYPSVAIVGMSPLYEDGKNGIYSFSIDIVGGKVVQFVYDYVKGPFENPRKAEAAADVDRANIELEWAHLAKIG